MEENKTAKTNSAAAAEKKRTKVFMGTSAGLVFLCEMTAGHHGYPTGTRREVKQQKHIFLKVQDLTRF